MSRSEKQKARRAELRRIAHDRAMHVCHRLNLPRYLCECAFGEKHDNKHRVGAGIVIMTIGVSVAKFGGHLSPLPIVEFIADWTGYLIHGAGSIPLIDIMLRKMRAEVGER